MRAFNCSTSHLIWKQIPIIIKSLMHFLFSDRHSKFRLVHDDRAVANLPVNILA
jgi:hypothetical protein